MNSVVSSFTQNFDGIGASLIGARGVIIAVMGEIKREVTSFQSEEYNQGMKLLQGGASERCSRVGGDFSGHVFM